MQPAPELIRVVLADDHALVRAGIRSLISAMPGVVVVDEARDGREAVAMVAEHLPDVLVLDITLPVLSGLHVLTRLGLDYPQVRVIMLSMHDNEEYVFHALRAGAAGYLLKDSSAGELEVAIRAVARGGSYLSPFVSRHVVADFVKRSAGEGGTLERLTSRQREIAQLIAEGRTNAEIADVLSISVKTVEAHRSQLMDRLQIHDVAGIVRFAVRTGLIPPDR